MLDDEITAARINAEISSSMDSILRFARLSKRGGSSLIRTAEELTPYLGNHENQRTILEQLKKQGVLFNEAHPIYKAIGDQLGTYDDDNEKIGRFHGWDIRDPHRSRAIPDYFSRPWNERRPAYDERFHLSEGFSEGLATVRNDKMTGWFHILPTGERAYENNEKFIQACSFNEALAIVLTPSPNLGWCHIDYTGKVVYKKRFEHADDFKEGVAAVSDTNLFDSEDPGYHHIDHSGECAYDDKDMRFKSVENFREGVAVAWDTLGWHHIKHSGECAYDDKDLRFNRVSGFRNGVADVTVVYNRLKINKQGEIVD